MNSEKYRIEQTPQSFTSMSNQEYRAAPGISSSDFRLLELSPLHYHHRDHFGLSGDSLDFGSALHKRVLEPDTFDQEFAVAPDAPRNTKEGKALHVTFNKELGDRTAISATDYEIIRRMSENVHAIAGGLFKGGVAESSHFATDEHGVLRKCRPDYLIESQGILIDIKTTKDASAYGFSKAIHEYRYHRQAAWYIDALRLAGKRAERFVFVVVEKSSPYMVRVYELDHEAIERGRDDYRRLLEEYGTFMQTHRCNVIQPIGLPQWAYEEEGA